jgi:hypothetical protein
MRSVMRTPARYAAAAANIPGFTHQANTFDIAGPAPDLTAIMPCSAVFRQPKCEVHYDDVADFAFNSHADNAVFSHAWAPDGRAMFTCGGPLAMGIRGCYLSLWA